MSFQSRFAASCGCPPAQTSAAMTLDKQEREKQGGGKGAVGLGGAWGGGGLHASAAAAVVSARHLPGRWVYTEYEQPAALSSPVLTSHRTHTLTHSHARSGIGWLMT